MQKVYTVRVKNKVFAWTLLPACFQSTQQPTERERERECEKAGAVRASGSTVGGRWTLTQPPQMFNDAL